MTDQLVREAYESWHQGINDDGVADAPWHRLVLAHLEPQRDVAGKTMLEVACGPGGFARALGAMRPAPRAVVAADFAHTALVKGKGATDNRNVRWVAGDIHMLPHRNEAFDTVISCETIEHLAAPRRALVEIARVLRPGGRLLLTTPNYLGPMGLYRAYLRVCGRPYTEVGQPINRLTFLLRTLAWVRSAGLRVATRDGIGHYVPWPGRPPIHVSRLDSPRPLMRWFALHSFVLAEKP